jgi:hypothetical protein
VAVLNTSHLKPWVILGATEIIQKFGVRTTYAWRPVDPFPDHPSGLAVDFMISDLPNGHAVGQQIADYVAANGGRLGVKYLIWNRRSFNVKRGTWEPYTSTTNPHTDHVHVTWNSDGLVGISIPVANTTDTAAVSNPLLDQLNGLAAFVTDHGNWLRYGMLCAGVVCVLLGIFKFNSVSTPLIQKAGDAVKGAIKNVG